MFHFEISKQGIYSTYIFISQIEEVQLLWRPIDERESVCEYDASYEFLTFL